MRWGNSPSDLDSHLVAKITDGRNEHIYYSETVGSAGNLDRDDTDYEGPETITITNFELLQNGFAYSVHDYSNRDDTNNYELSSSNAIVRLYKGDTLLRTYNVPTDRVGTVWNVFGVNGNGDIIDINTFENVSEPSEVGKNLF